MPFWIHLFLCLKIAAFAYKINSKQYWEDGVLIGLAACGSASFKRHLTARPATIYPTLKRHSRSRNKVTFCRLCRNYLAFFQNPSKDKVVLN